MERGAAVKLRGSAGAFLACAIGAVLSFASSARAEPCLWLVVSEKSPVLELNSVQVQRLFLGLTVIVDDRRQNAVRNESDELMHRVFFQNIVFLSEAAYDRRMLALTLQQGRTPPPVVRSLPSLLELMARDPDAVSYAWAEDIARHSRLRALRVLWCR